MKKFILVISFVLLASSIAFASNLKDKQKNLKSLNRNITHIQSSIETASNKQSKLTDMLKISEQAIGNTNIHIANINAQIKIKESKLNTIQEEKDLLNEKINKQQSQLAKQIKLTYMSSEPSTLEKFLDKTKKSNHERLLIYYQYLDKKRLSFIENLQKNMDRIEVIQNRIQKEEDDLSQLQDSYRQKKSSLRKEKKNRTFVLNEINKRIRTNKIKLDSLLSNKKSLTKLIKTLNRKKAFNSRSFVKLKGKLHWPTAGVLLQSFNKPLPETRLISSGEIISASEGKPIYSIAKGKVIFANWLKGFGLITIIDHGNGYMSLYGRSSQLYKKVGESVNSRELIATVGKSGGFSKNSLYFEIRRQGKPVDPALWCS